MASDDFPLRFEVKGAKNLEPTPESVKAAIREPEIPPHLVITHFDFDDVEWPHPGESDKGPILELLTILHACASSDLKAADGRLRMPSPQELGRMDDLCSGDLFLACETYLKGLERGKRWRDPRMQELYEKYLSTTLSWTDCVDVVRYVLEQHQEGGPA